jgi:ribonuclease D
VLSHPERGVPQLTDTAAGLADAIERLRSAPGPVALDAERAQSFRYTAKAYLIQLRRRDSDTILVDPTAFEDGAGRADLSSLAAALADAEWIIHAATNDLLCLAEVGLVPRRLFDTELAGRLLNLEKVNLSALMGQFLGVSLAKKHSAEDWSQRPLPASWRAYAALDVERLVDLRDALAEQLQAQGRWDIAEQEFAHLVAHAADPARPQPDPWRRTSNIHLLRSRRALAVVRELWLARDAIASATDTAPGKLLPDQALVAAATRFEGAERVTTSRLRRIPAFAKRGAVEHLDEWARAVNAALALPEDDLPERSRSKKGPLHQGQWRFTQPELFERYQRIRSGLRELSDAVGIPSKNLIEPEALRQIIWQAQDGSPDDIEDDLARIGVRSWQSDLTAKIIAANW